MHELLLWPFTALPENHVVLDTETTGLFAGDQAPDLVSLGMAVVEKNEIAASLEYLVRPETEYRDQADQIHGISWQEAQEHPQLSESWEEICAQLSGQLILAHNALFDWRVLASAAHRRDLQLPAIQGVFCAQRAAQPWAMANGIECSERGPSLNALLDFLGIDNTRAAQGGVHGAVMDACRTAAVIQRLKKMAELLNGD